MMVLDMVLGMAPDMLQDTALVLPVGLLARMAEGGLGEMPGLQSPELIVVCEPGLAEGAEHPPHR